MANPPDAITASENANAENVQFPLPLVWTVILLCALPTVLNGLGVDFTTTNHPNPEQMQGLSAIELNLLLLRLRSAESIHTLLEWSAFLIALATVVFAFTHYHVKRDVTTPIIGTALFFSGMLDGFHTLGSDELIAVSDLDRFIPFTWAISRASNAFFLILGAAPFLARDSAATRKFGKQGPRFIVLWVILFALMAWTIIFCCAAFPQLPQTVYPDSPYVYRPWDMIALVLYLLAGAFVFPRFYRMQPSVLSHSLMVSVIPNVAAQLHAAFGSSHLFDNHFNIAHFEKLIAYTVPLVALLLDYTRAYRVELTLHSTAEKLRVARDVQQGLLPQEPPRTPGFDLAGACAPTDAVGGDYFDYVTMDGDKVGIVVADVSGHEIGASILLAETRAYVRALVQTHKNVGEIITRLNQLLAVDLQTRWFVTMFFIELDPGSHSFVYAGAGHEGYVMDVAGKVTTLASTATPLGIQEDRPLACSDRIEIKPGDVLLSMTDGVVEAKSPDGGQFGIERAWNVIRAHREQSAAGIVDALIAAVRDFCGKTSLPDDVTVVVIKEDSGFTKLA